MGNWIGLIEGNLVEIHKLTQRGKGPARPGGSTFNVHRGPPWADPSLLTKLSDPMIVNNRHTSS